MLLTFYFYANDTWADISCEKDNLWQELIKLGDGPEWYRQINIYNGDGDLIGAFNLGSEPFTFYMLAQEILNVVDLAL